MRFLPGRVPRPIEHVQKFLEVYIQSSESCWGAWAIIHKQGAHLIGHFGMEVLQPGNHDELFYAIGKTYWGQGLVTEAAQAVVKHSFDNCGFDTIIAQAVPANTASRRVMEKIGMQYRGLVNQYYNAELALYDVTREQFKNMSRPL
jgi:RimJ/RimL family protein N-acetyltransferase